jgi:heme O synthase-like polyprenyltransferase
MLFLGQFPRFVAIAWMYREDYDRAGYLVQPRGNQISFRDFGNSLGAPRSRYY